MYAMHVWVPETKDTGSPGSYQALVSHPMWVLEGTQVLRREVRSTLNL